MTDHDIRTAHKLLDTLFDKSELSHAQIGLLRSLLPELPKQTTLAEIIAHVDDAWSVASGYEWGGNSYDSEISIEDWLSDLKTQLEGLTEESGEVPALPVGMRFAKHENYGRVIATGWIDSDNEHFCVYYSDVLKRGSYVFLPESSLTFLDSKPAHPEFLETEADYASAPAGTVAAKDGWLAWVKQKNGDWSCDGGTNGESELVQSGRRRVLRWGWTNE